jgi:hypothetical protein
MYHYKWFDQCELFHFSEEVKSQDLKQSGGLDRNGIETRHISKDIGMIYADIHIQNILLCVNIIQVLNYVLR